MYALAVDGAGNVYATGQTDSLDFPTQAATQGTCDMTNEFCSDGFVLRINAAGTLIDYSSYLGGAWYDSGNGVAVTASGEAYVTGVVNTGDQSEYGDGDSAFLAKFAGDGTQQYRLLLGGPGEDGASSVTVADPTDSQSAVYLTGWTTSGAIAANNASAGFDAYHGGTYDAFLMQLSPQGAIQRTSLIGGDDWDAGADVAVNANGNIFVAGATSSSVSFPAVQAPDNNAGTGTNAFLIMLTADQTNIGLSMQLGGSAGLFGNGSSASAVAVDQMGNAYLVGETYSSDFAGGPTNEDSGVLSRGFLSKVDGLPLAPPEYTVSYYIRDPDSLAAFQLGCDARLNGERGIVVLSFGTPRQFFNDQQQAVTGVMMKGGADVGYLSFNDMSAISVSYAYGYTYWRNCPNIPAASGFEPPPARLTIALGTNNAKRCKPSSDCDERQADDWENNPFLTRQHGETWAAMVNTLNAQTRQLFPGVSFAGAMDVEFDLTTFGSVGTFEWLKGYNSVAAWPYYNYGSCDGCPRTADFDTWGGGPRPDRTNTGGRATTELASNDYPTDALLQAGDARTTVEKVFLASRWFEWALPLPQIYYKDQHLQWYNVVRYASSELRPMFIPGPLTGCASQPQACGLSDKRSWEQPAFGQFPTVPFSPYQGWQALHDTLNGTQAPDGTTPSPISQPFMPWLTDLTSQDLPTAP